MATTQPPSRSRRAGSVLVLAIALLATARPSLAGPAVEPEPLFLPAQAPARQLAQRPQVKRQRFARLERARLGERVSLNLFADLQVVATRQRLESTGPDSSVWSGRIDGREGTVVLSSVRGVTVGTVRLEHGVFEIRPVGDGITAISEIDTSRFPREGCDAADDGETTVSAATPPPPAGDVQNDPCNIIDIMVLYTPAVLDTYGSPEAVEALIHYAINEANASYENSDVTSRLVPVHIAEVDYEEAFLSDEENGDVFDDRDFMIDTDDGVLDEVPVLRDQYCADMVMLITHYGGAWCGGAKVMDPAPDDSHESQAYAVTVDDCALTNLTFPHEFGHVQGAQHDWYVSAATTPYTYAHGYVNRSKKVRTIMAYNDECDDLGFECIRMPYWSNPNVFILGDPAGVPEGTDTSCTVETLSNPDCDAEDWRVLNNTDCTVANFRKRDECIHNQAQNVWMKDSWNDGGLEPDPSAFGDDMWTSPYIWVRNELDVNGEHQHQHESPETAATNYVYTKLHNDFDVQSTGRLKLYYAETSMWMKWPDDWTEFSNAQVVIGPHSTLLTPTTWTPPAVGDYSFLARWDTPNNPADPMAAVEGASVSTNARSNNNIVWRNVHAVNLVPDFAAELPGIKAKNPNPVPKVLDIAIEQPPSPKNFLAQGGAILLDLGGLLDNWQTAGGMGSGVNVITHPVYGQVVQVDSSVRGTATLEGIPLAAFESETVRFILTAPRIPQSPPFPPIDDEPPTGGDAAIPDQTRGDFFLELVQIDGTERVGGVGYEIHVALVEGSGTVPDGGPIPGEPLTVNRAGTSALVLDWGASCRATDVDYAIYAGVIGDFESHVPVTCNTGNTTVTTIPMPAGSMYYLIVPTDKFTDGSYGLDGDGVERRASSQACRPHAVSACGG